MRSQLEYEIIEDLHLSIIDMIEYFIRYIWIEEEYCIIGDNYFGTVKIWRFYFYIPYIYEVLQDTKTYTKIVVWEYYRYSENMREEKQEVQNLEYFVKYLYKK